MLFCVGITARLLGSTGRRETLFWQADWVDREAEMLHVGSESSDTVAPSPSVVSCEERRPSGHLSPAVTEGAAAGLIQPGGPLGPTRPGPTGHALFVSTSASTCPADTYTRRRHKTGRAASVMSRAAGVGTVQLDTAAAGQVNNTKPARKPRPVHHTCITMRHARSIKPGWMNYGWRLDIQHCKSHTLLTL